MGQSMSASCAASTRMPREVFGALSLPRTPGQIVPGTCQSLNAAALDSALWTAISV